MTDVGPGVPGPAAAVLELRGADFNGRTLIVSAAGSSMSVVPALPWTPGAGSTALSGDGRWLTMLAERPGGGRVGVAHDLVIGVTLPFAQDVPDVELASPSPDGRRVACLCVDDDCRLVVGVPGGPTDTVWSVPDGGTNAESVVSWSPGGTYIASTWVTPDDEWVVTVVDSSSGGRLFVGPEHRMLPAAGGTWRSDNELVVIDPDGRLAILDVAGQRTVHRGDRRSPFSPMALIGDRLVGRLPKPTGEPLRIASTLLDGSDLRPVLSVPLSSFLSGFDVAPALVDLDAWDDVMVPARPGAG